MSKTITAIIHDLENWDHWVQFNNFSVKDMTENLKYINILDYYQDYFPSLEPFFACIDSLHDNDGNYAAAGVWLHKPEKPREVR